MYDESELSGARKRTRGALRRSVPSSGTQRRKVQNFPQSCTAKESGKNAQKSARRTGVMDIEAGLGVRTKVDVGLFQLARLG